MGKARVYRSVNKRVAHLPDVKDAVADVAETILATAEASAPVDSGDYKKKLTLVRGKTDTHVVAEAEHSADVEYGHFSELTGDWVDGHHVLSRAADSAR